jgi:uncharacterized protein with HEPN domain
MKTDHDYLVDLLDRIDRIEDFTRSGEAAFVQSELIQDAVIRNFEVIGEITKRLPDVMLEQPHIEWQQIKGFRDFLAHYYDRIVLKIVWESVENLPGLDEDEA